MVTSKCFVSNKQSKILDFIQKLDPRACDDVDECFIDKTNTIHFSLLYGTDLTQWKFI